MKIKIIIAVVLIGYVMAEAPIGDSYSYPVPNGQRSLSQEYGPPGFGARNQNLQLSSKYGPPELSQNARLSNEYLPPQRSLSQEYGVPSRNIDSSEVSEEYGTPNQRSLQQYGVPSARILDSSVYTPKERTLSQEYGVPTSRNLDTFASSEEYNPSGRTLSQDYVVPVSEEYKSFASSRKLSQKYGPPARFIDTSVRDLSRQYGVPKTRSQNALKSQVSKTRNLGVPQEFGTERSFDSSVPSDSYGAPLQRSFDSISSEYGVPQTRVNAEKSAFRSQEPISQTYGVPRSQSYSKNSRFGGQNEVSTTYGVPRISSQYGVPSLNTKTSFRKPSEAYGVPNERSLNEVSGRSKTNAFTSSSYLPPARDAMPSTEYGVPDVNSISNQGYSYARNALDELINQEPANYDFGYKVNDVQSGSDFGHTETRQENKAEGSYFVVLPDGTKQVVEYEADDQGFRPRISVEAVDIQGYDENASDLTRSGPY